MRRYNRERSQEHRLRVRERAGPREQVLAHSTWRSRTLIMNGRVLLDAGADPNAIGPGYTALHMVTWLRKSGGGDNDPSPQGSGL